ncbi:MAG: ABC transporter permease [Sinobacteraceae bacterium]|nr:ABC transporter permease [Nevskiaceae bacterium]
MPGRRTGSEWGGFRIANLQQACGLPPEISYRAGPRRQSARWIGLKTLLLRECAVIVRFWGVTLAPPAVSTLLYFIVFGEIIGKRIGSIDGFAYIQFMVPGVIVLWVIPYSFGHAAGGFLGAKFFKYIEELLVSPLPYWVIMAGYVTGGLARGILVGVTAAVISLCFTHVHVYSVLLGLTAIALAAIIAALAGFITGLFVNSFEQVFMIQGLILTPLMYLGGVFNSLSTLPVWAQTLSRVNPMFYMVNAFRYGLLGDSDVPIGLSLTLMSAASVVLLLVAWALLARGAGIRD